MKKIIKIVLTVLSIALILIGIYNAILGEGPGWIAIGEVVSGLLLFWVSIVTGTKWSQRNIFGKMVRVIGVSMAVIFTLLGTGALWLGLNTKGAPVADIDRKVDIWGEMIPGNRPDSKLPDMNIKPSSRLMKSTIQFVSAIVGTEYVDSEQAIDTFTYLHGIKGGYEEETYEDVPYLIPYTVSGSDSAVIVIPGGGYGYKSIDGGTGEGRDIALSLNKAGINAYVLWYRSNPYEMPIPQLDVQRAVRYLRYHSEDYNINPQKISLIGYSAGGYQIGSFINQIQGKNLFPEDYVPDAIDAIDDSVTTASMIYPALTYKYNVPMLFSSFDDDEVRDPNQRVKLLEATDLSKHFNSKEVSQFICYGTSDGMVGMDGAKEYISAGRTEGADITEVSAEGQDHGFSQKYYMDTYLSWLKEKMR